MNVNVGAIIVVCAAAVVVAILVTRAKTHFDYLTVFRFFGDVVDADSHVPVRDALIVFRDEGLDYKRSLGPDFFKHVVGTSDDEGGIDVSLEYLWGFNASLLKRKPGKDFSVLISKEGYNTVSRRFDLGRLKETGNRVAVDLDTVELKPSHSYAPPKIPDGSTAVLPRDQDGQTV